MSAIVNASPATYLLGTDDKSNVAQLPETPVISALTPLVMLFTEKGPETKVHASGGQLTKLFGSKTFDTKYGFYNHATKFAETLSGGGCSLMMKRLIPSDATTIANVTIYLDVISDTVDILSRNTDGSIYYDGSGDPVVIETITGYRVKVIAETSEDTYDSKMGLKTSKTGKMVDLATGTTTTSTMWPVLELRGSYRGEAYNNNGIAFDIPLNEDLNTALVSEEYALPYEIYLYERSSATATGTINKNIYGGVKSEFTFKPNTNDPNTDAALDLKTILENWSNTTDATLPLEYPEFTDPYIYKDNIATLLTMFMTSETPYIYADITCQDTTVVNTSEWFDFTAATTDVTAEDQKYIFNFLTMMSTKRVPYFSVIIDETTATMDTGQTEIFPASNLPVYLGNGTDGTLNNTNFEALVVAEMAKYADTNSEVMDTAINLENAYFDSGFSIDTKKACVDFISTRKDTYLSLTTYIDNADGDYEDLETDRAVAVNLKARLALAPESVYFGTGVARATVCMGSGIESVGVSGHRYPQSMDLASKMATMMSGINWKSELIFDSGAKAIIDTLKDLQPEFIPGGVKPNLWSAGIIWSQPYDQTRYHFPALQTVYDLDTSVLNNLFTVMALTVINKVADATHREYTGNASMSTDVFIDAVETYAADLLRDKFDGIVTVIPKARITDYDKARGYSYTLMFELGSNVLKTVQTTYVEAYREEDLPA